MSQIIEFLLVDSVFHFLQCNLYPTRGNLELLWEVNVFLSLKTD